jgi:Predicted dehydrogenases and related proteins
MENIRVGVIGIGIMGGFHAQQLAKLAIPGACLAAVCDISGDRLKWAVNNLGENIRLYDNADDMLKNGNIDAVIIATPHYYHPDLAIKAFYNGLHVLIEKPAGVYAKSVREMNEVASKSNKVFGIMYNQRTNPLYQQLRDLIQAGELGEIRRTNWIITDWYRTQHYYNSGGWRATWAGEGGGVLLNQCPHNLDLWQWTCGMPKRVRAFISFGKYHDIEVEDDVTAYVEYSNGATGVFITSTGDCPGTNRFEVTGDRGKIIIENGKLTFWRLRVPERQFNKEFRGGSIEPECWKCEIPAKGIETSHTGIITDWVNSISNGTPLLAPGMEGINGLEISNAMYLSAWTDSWVELPVDEEFFYEKLQEKVNNSSAKKI